MFIRPSFTCLDENEWGLLASSSSRLARDLLLYCFTDETSQMASSTLHITTQPQQQKSPTVLLTSLVTSTGVPDREHVTSATTTTTTTTLSTSPTFRSSPSLADSPTATQLFHTPTGSPIGTLGGLGGAFSTNSPKFFTPPTR